MVRAERAAERLADVSRAEGWGKIEDGAQNEGSWVRWWDGIAWAIWAVGEGGGNGRWVGKSVAGGGEWWLKRILSDERRPGEAAFISLAELHCEQIEVYEECDLPQDLQ